jgi:hypothetical protein
MSAQLELDGIPGRTGEDALSATRRGIIERLADPYLTEHDRWVLRQFAQFLSGVTPGPDPRVAPARAAQPLRRQTRWTRV